MKSLMSLWSRVAEESAIRCCTSATEDINTVLRRTEHEGLSFLTITLPDLGKAIQKWLDQGRADPVPAFASRQGLPLFLGGFLDLVFDRCSGLLLEEPSIDAIIAVRQLTLMFGKISLPCSDARVRKAMQGFIECEQDVRYFDSQIRESDLLEFEQMSRLLFTGIFTRVDRDIYYGNITPKHGPGNTADHLSSNGKYDLRSWTERLERVFPARENIIPNERFSPILDNVDVLEPGSETPVKVVPVPKTLKTPRIIAMEPSCMQYMQQGVLGSILNALERDELLSNLIGFDDQVPNQELARQGSLQGETATLDLSDASDRVSNQLVRAMTNRWPHLHKAIDATRSRRAVVNGHGEIRLSKYASMGSALCFPFEAMVFLTIILIGIQRSLNTSLSRQDVKRLVGSVRVYGDDLIVPVDHVLSIVRTLEHFGARVGTDKSFWTGRFRESCGREYFMGEDVSIVRVRQALPDTMAVRNRRPRKEFTGADATKVISAVSLRNQLYMSGYWKVCQWLDGHLGFMLKHFPDVLPTSPVLGRVCSLGYQSERTNPRLQSPQVRGFVVEAKPPSDKLEGAGALLKCLLKLGKSPRLRASMPWDSPNPFEVDAMGENLWLRHEQTGFANPADEKHLERSGRPKHVSIKLRWSSPH